MAQFTIYRSTDSSAPVLSATVGSLVAVLDACLVNGYGSKTAAGWTKAFSGTNKAAYLQGTGSSGFYFRVQDDAPNNGGEARGTGYVTMSDVDTGTNPFPTAAQGLSGSVAALCLRKSQDGSGSTPCPWIVVADSRTVYIFTTPGDVANTYCCFVFGDFYSLKPTTDAYRCMIVGRTAEATGSGSAESFSANSAVSSSTTGHFVAREYGGTGASIPVGKHGDAAATNNVGLLGPGLVGYPNPTDGYMYLNPLWIHDVGTTPANSLRGRMRGIWQLLNPTSSVSNGDTGSGASSGNLAGKTFLFIKNSPNTSMYVIETSNTLESN